MNNNDYDGGRNFERVESIYRKLEFLKSTNKKLHINIIAGGDKGKFRNGFIIDISLSKRCLVFIDDVLGELPYLFEEIDVERITFYREEGKNETEDKYSSWNFVYEEISNLKAESTRLGIMVRINNKSSPDYLNSYYSALQSFLTLLAHAIGESTWAKVEKLLISCKEDIQNYFKEKTNNVDKIIPVKLIEKLDTLYQIALLAERKIGMGVKLEKRDDSEEMK